MKIFSLDVKAKDKINQEAEYYDYGWTNVYNDH